MEISDKLFYEKVVIIKYRSQNSKGMIVVKYSHFNKHANKYLKTLEDCEVDMEIKTYTPDMEGEIKHEFERLHES